MKSQSPKGKEMAKTRNMSVALESDFQDKLKKLAHTKGISVSFLIRETLEKYLFANKDTVKLVLHVPKDLTKSPDQMQLWLNQKCTAILSHFKS